MNSVGIGQLVYIPSNTDLLQYNKKNSPTKITQTQLPRNLIVLKEDDKELGVLFEGEVWYVDKKKVYNV
tara:strand:+ start:406 stop:612 length:207 start_codon:yes stop_codon:yes gene_type:complete